ncbi:hypothetical protein D187_010345 [Cystobacter fuscus DSM 2262]|uniref:Uncharacterized protein n=1 Tax=Cystobacter fuscus (strain ATCC 25194 / DSM 2262 / NBRC 100088 / M29) TaxID=1242864 RepID=S9PFA3_CYSF2|nr:hypothetical protein [Cystobacter fuscus]EPX61726.1 hypothetical protein D187_010345 [Cystobacter fuscus DSM 2262]
MSLIDGVKRGVSRATHTVAQKTTALVKNPAKAAETAKSAFDGYQKLRSTPKDVFDNARAVKRDGFKATVRNNWSKAAEKATNPKDTLNKLGVAKKLSGAVGTVTNAVKLPGQVGTAIKDVRDALRSGSAEQRDKAIGSVATAAKTAINTVKGGLELTRDVQKFGGAYRAASQAFRTAAPNATGKAVRAAATTAARHAFQGATEGVARRGVQEAVKKVAQNGTSIANTMGAATRAAGRTLAREGAEAAGKAAVQAGVRAAAGPVAKAAGRFVPGANVAIAALDVASAYSTVKDPKASTTKKVTSVITAVGSVAAATNIPVVSQVGAAVSTVSSFVGGLFG